MKFIITSPFPIIIGLLFWSPHWGWHARPSTQPCYVFIGNKFTKEHPILGLQDLKESLIALHDRWSFLLWFSAEFFWELERWKSSELISYGVHQFFNPTVLLLRDPFSASLDGHCIKSWGSTDFSFKSRFKLSWSCYTFTCTETLYEPADSEESPSIYLSLTWIHLSLDMGRKCPEVYRTKWLLNYSQPVDCWTPTAISAALYKIICQVIHHN